MSKLFISLLCLLISADFCFSQDSTGSGFMILKTPPIVKIKVSGKLTDSSGVAIPGATIRSVKNSMGTVTDFNGNYNLEIDSNDKLKIEYLGYNSINIGSRDTSITRGSFRLNQQSGVIKSVETAKEELKIFPTKVPTPSSSFEISSNSFKGNTRFGKIDSILRKALDACGYDEKRYYYFNSGFALVTQMEQTSNKGFSLSENYRWNSKIRTELNTPWNYIYALLHAPVGYYRIFVFLVSTSNVSPEPTSNSQDIAKAWLKSGYFSLPSELKNRSISDNFHVNLLIYQYEKHPGEQASYINPGEITGRMHYIRSGLSAKL